MNHLNIIFDGYLNRVTNIHLYSCIVLLYYYISEVKVYLIDNRVSIFYSCA